MYSALKRGGRPLYELARAGITVERRRRRVEVHRIELVAWQPPLVTVEVECSKGTYIRSLAHDLGQALGCGASLRSLARLACGPFNVASGLSLAEFEEAVRRGCWPQLLHPIDSALSHLRAVVVDEETARAIRNGSSVALGDGEREASAEEWCRAYSQDGQLLGVLRFEPGVGLWHPDKVLA
jgi:tRNA pseudouridine55 synthase